MFLCGDNLKCFFSGGNFLFGGEGIKFGAGKIFQVGGDSLHPLSRENTVDIYVYIYIYYIYIYINMIPGNAICDENLDSSLDY